MYDKKVRAIKALENDDYNALKLLEFYRSKFGAIDMNTDAKKVEAIELRIGSLQTLRQQIRTKLSELRKDEVNIPISKALGIKVLAT